MCDEVCLQSVRLPFPHRATRAIVHQSSHLRHANRFANTISRTDSYYDMTKRPCDSITASTFSEPRDRQASHDVEGVGSLEDADGVALKKARSFMATLVNEAVIFIWPRLTNPGLRYLPFEEDTL
jgi:hypothetical protein